MYLEIENLSKSFDGKEVVSGLKLSMNRGEILCLLGASGCGKTTTLRMLGGFLKPDGGKIFLDGEDITGLEPERRPVSTVFQSYALFPHMTVLQNVMYGLKFQGMKKKEAAECAYRYLDIVGLSDRGNGAVQELSGGQQQRVALARALAVNPKVLLLDEPLSNLDAKLRIRMRDELKELQKKTGITMIFVTHDQEEALAISDRIAVMKLGIIQQIGSPQDIYARPYNAFVSTFIGHSNLFFGTIRKQGGVPSVVFEGGYHVEMPNLVDTVTEGQRVVVSVRPEEFSLNREGMDCEIISRTFLGKYTNYFLRFGEGMVLEDQPSIEYSQDLGHVDRIFAVGEKIRLRPNPNKINVFTQDMEQSLIKDVKRYDE